MIATGVIVVVIIAALASGCYDMVTNPKRLKTRRHQFEQTLAKRGYLLPYRTELALPGATLAVELPPRPRATYWLLVTRVMPDGSDEFQQLRRLGLFESPETAADGFAVLLARWGRANAEELDQLWLDETLKRLPTHQFV